MAYLFEVRGLRVVPTTEVLLVEPFKALWERDGSKDKVVAIREFTYIEFMSSMKGSNPYSGYGEEERHRKLVEDIFGGKYSPDKLVLEGIGYIKELQMRGSPTYRYYTAALEGAEKIKDFFLTFDISERTKKGVPLYKPGDITKALNDTERVVANLGGLKEKMERELYEVTKTRSGKVINPFEK